MCRAMREGDEFDEDNLSDSGQSTICALPGRTNTECFNITFRSRYWSTAACFGLCSVRD